MKRSIILFLITISATAQVLAANNHFDGKHPLFCTAVRMFECDLTQGCVPVTADELGVASAWDIDFKKRSMTPATREGAPNPIQHTGVIDGKIFLTSIQDGSPTQSDGVAWSASINAADGLMTIMLAGEGVGFVALGSCVPK